MLFQSYYGPQVNPIVLLIGISLLVVIVVVLGHRRGASGIRHWTFAAAKVSIIFILWQILSFCMFIIFMTFTSGPEEQRIVGANIASMIIFIGLIILLLFIETRHNPNRSNVNQL